MWNGALINTPPPPFLKSIYCETFYIQFLKKKKKNPSIPNLNLKSTSSATHQESHSSDQVKVLCNWLFILYTY